MRKESTKMVDELITFDNAPTSPRSQLANAIVADYVKVPVIEQQTESGEHTPRYPVHCKKCGFAGEKVKFPTSLGKVRESNQKATYELSVKCPDCKKDIDTIEITVIFNAMSNWMVGKKHVG